MSSLPSQSFHDYLAQQVIGPFYEVRLSNLKKLQLKSILKRKNPYLFKAKNIELAGDLMKAIVDAFISSQRKKRFLAICWRALLFTSQKLYMGASNLP